MSRPHASPGLPRWLILPAVIGFLVITIPLLALALRADPARLWSLLTQPSSLDALWLSLRTAAVSTVVCLALGVPMALVFARARFIGRNVLRALVLVPLVLPPVIGGIALLYTFGRRGLLGQVLEVAGIRLPFTTVAVVMAQVFVSLPFVVLGIEGAARSTGERFEGIAATLGASPTRVLLHVTLPMIVPGLVSGAVMAFARSLGEFGATLAFAGSLQGVTRTLPLQIYLVRESDADSAVALALVLIVLAIAGVALAYRPATIRRESP
ncbi:ABC transporter permease [Microbacterium sp.]|uniref:ABC transporter permease n=1 Tax=Microbacterium sp. TaxID=51671 RepID=UPI0025E132D7|nr:ABC transporter permease [Microbacterium sp.]